MWWLLLVAGLVMAGVLADWRVRRYQCDIEVGLGRENRKPGAFTPPPVHDRAGPH
jgi:hypothetical protein